MVPKKMVLEPLRVEAFEDLSGGRLLHFGSTHKLHVFRGTEAPVFRGLAAAPLFFSGYVNYILC